ITPSKPLIGLNRARAAKLQVTEPTPDQLFHALVLDESKLRTPLVKRRRHSPDQDVHPDDDEIQTDFRVEPGDVAFDAQPIELMRRLRRIHDNARTTVEERGVATLYLTFGALRWHDDL